MKSINKFIKGVLMIIIGILLVFSFCTFSYGWIDPDKIISDLSTFDRAPCAYGMGNEIYVAYEVWDSGNSKPTSVRIKYTDDYGNNWKTVGIIPYGKIRLPQIVVDGYGYVVYVLDDQNPIGNWEEVYLSRFRLNCFCTNDCNIETNPCFTRNEDEFPSNGMKLIGGGWLSVETRPSISIESPYISIAYTNGNQVYFTHSKDNGKTWSSPKSVGGGKNIISLQVRGGFDIEIVWDTDDGIYYTMSRDSGEHWTKPILISPKGARYPNINHSNPGRDTFIVYELFIWK